MGEREGRSVAVTTKVAPSTAAAIDEVRGQLTRSAWVASLIDAALEGRPPTDHPEDLEGNPADGGLQGEQGSPGTTGSCPHPKEDRDVKPYGTWCGRCKARIR